MKNILHKKTATKEELRKALADALGVAYTPFKKYHGNEATIHGVRIIIDKWYENTHGKPFIWSARHNKAIADLVRQTDVLVTNYNQRQATEQQVLEAFNTILLNLPKWYVTNFTPALIAGKFNELTAEIKLNASKETQNVVRSAFEMMYGFGWNKQPKQEKW